MLDYFTNNFKFSQKSYLWNVHKYFAVYKNYIAYVFLNFRSSIYVSYYTVCGFRVYQAVGQTFYSPFSGYKIHFWDSVTIHSVRVLFSFTVKLQYNSSYSFLLYSFFAFVINTQLLHRSVSFLPHSFHSSLPRITCHTTRYSKRTTILL